MVSSRGGLSRFLVQDGSFLAWSPDSRSIAARATLPNGPGIVLIDVHSGAVRPLAQALDVEGADFSPKGDRIVYAVGRGPATGLFTIAVDGGTPITIDDGHRSQWPVWGRAWIAYTRWQGARGRRQLALVKPDGTAVRQITHSYYPMIRPVDVARDGTRFLIEITKPTSPFAATYDLSTGRLRWIGRPAPDNRGHGIVPSAISRDGRAVLGTTGTLARPDGLDVVTLPFAGGHLTTLVRHAAAPSWSR